MAYEPIFKKGDEVVYYLGKLPQVGVIYDFNVTTKLFDPKVTVEYRLHANCNIDRPTTKLIHRWEDELKIDFPNSFFTDLYRLTIM